MKILVDMNLSPGWVDFLIEAGFEAVHQARQELSGGALVSIDTARARLRLLPLRQ
jgi:predicted nuclease of predicted toxin-antitoxin system